MNPLRWRVVEKARIRLYPHVEYAALTCLHRMRRTTSASFESSFTIVAFSLVGISLLIPVVARILTKYHSQSINETLYTLSTWVQAHFWFFIAAAVVVACFSLVFLSLVDSYSSYKKRVSRAFSRAGYALPTESHWKAYRSSYYRGPRISDYSTITEISGEWMYVPLRVDKKIALIGLGITVSDAYTRNVRNMTETDLDVMRELQRELVQA